MIKRFVEGQSLQVDCSLYMFSSTTVGDAWGRCDCEAWGGHIAPEDEGKDVRLRLTTMAYSHV